MKKNNLIWSFIVITIVVSITGAVVLAKNINVQDETVILKSKLRDEMNYLDGKISSMINSLNNITLTNYIVEERKISSQDAESNQSNNTSESGKSGSEEGSSSGSSSEEGSSQSSRRV